MRKCTSTDLCVILNFVRISQDLLILDEFELKNFFIVTSNFKNSIYPQSFLCEEAEMKQRTSSKKELCGIGEKPIWKFR